MEEREFEACIRRIRAGDQNGLKEIYEAYVGLVYSVIYDMTRQKEDAQDVTSEFFIRLWERADSYRPGGGHRGWMLTIARNLAVDFLRKRNREYLVEETEPVQEDDKAQDFADAVVGNLNMQEAIAKLKASEQEVLDMKVMGQMTFREISDVLQKPMGTVTWLYRQGIAKLRAYYEPGEEAQR